MPQKRVPGLKVQKFFCNSAPSQRSWGCTRMTGWSVKTSSPTLGLEAEAPGASGTQCTHYCSDTLCSWPDFIIFLWYTLHTHSTKSVLNKMWFSAPFLLRAALLENSFNWQRTGSCPVSLGFHFNTSLQGTLLKVFHLVIKINNKAKAPNSIRLAWAALTTHE